MGKAERGPLWSRVGFGFGAPGTNTSSWLCLLHPLSICEGCLEIWFPSCLLLTFSITLYSAHLWLPQELSWALLQYRKFWRRDTWLAQLEELAIVSLGL